MHTPHFQLHTPLPASPEGLSHLPVHRWWMPGPCAHWEGGGQAGAPSAVTRKGREKSRGLWSLSLEPYRPGCVRKSPPRGTHISKRPRDNCVISHVITSSSLPSLSPLRKLDIPAARSALGWPCLRHPRSGQRWLRSPVILTATFALPLRRPIAVARTRRRPTSSSASRLCTECTRTRHSRTPSRSNRGTSHLQPSRSSQGRV